MVLTTSLKISTFPLTKWSYTNYPLKNDYSHIQNYSPFLSRVTKRVRVPSRHLIYIERASISIIIIILGISSIIIIIILNLRSHQRRWRRSLRSEAIHDCLPWCYTADTNVHLIQLSRECMKASLYALKLCHDVFKSHIARRRGGSRCGWSRSRWRRMGRRSC